MEILVTRVRAEDGALAGTMPRHAAHAAPGHLHLAVSTQVVDAGDDVLLQRRAEGKTLFAGLWANSFCTHPLPGEDIAAAVTRRGREELGMRLAFPSHLGAFTYRAEDPVSGLVEHELDHVFAEIVDRATTTLAVDDEEVAEVAWLPLGDALALASTPSAVPWLAPVLALTARWLDGSR